MNSTMIMMLILSMITPIMNNPLSLGMVLIMQTIMSCMMMSMFTKTSWFSFIMFITMISGLMIMFMYMSSITSNNKMKLNTTKLPIMMISITIIITIISSEENFMNYKILLNKSSEQNMFTLKNEEIKSTSKMMNLNKNKLTMLTMLYLMISMISITNIINNNEGPLKKTYV